MENSNTLRICTFLDPKFKELAFSSDSIATSVKETVIQLVAAKICKKSQGKEQMIEV